MRKVKVLFKALFINLLCWPSLLMAQDGGLFIDGLEVADSSYMEQEFMADAIFKSSGPGNMVLFIILVLILLAALGLYIIKKRRNNTLSRQSGTSAG